MKRCTTCLREFPDHEFWRHDQVRRGRRKGSLCKRCQLEREGKRLRAKLAEIDAAWEQVNAQQQRREDHLQAIEQRRIEAAGK